MQTQFSTQAIVDQCLALISPTEYREGHWEGHLMLSEHGKEVSGVVTNFSNHYAGRLKLHLYDGRYVSWRLPQHVIDSVANIIRIDGNDGKLAPKGWSHV